MSGSERRPETSWGEPVPRVYGPADVPADAAREAPGEFPFTRGIHPSGYRSRLWTMRQYAGFGSAGGPSGSWPTSPRTSRAAWTSPPP